MGTKDGCGTHQPRQEGMGGNQDSLSTQEQGTRHITCSAYTPQKTDGSFKKCVEELETSPHKNIFF